MNAEFENELILNLSSTRIKNVDAKILLKIKSNNHSIDLSAQLKLRITCNVTETNYLKIKNIKHMSHYKSYALHYVHIYFLPLLWREDLKFY